MNEVINDMINNEVIDFLKGNKKIDGLDPHNNIHRKISDKIKEYVKRLNQLVSKKQTILEEKYQKDIIKLEQIQSQGLSQKNIQERTKYSIEFLIKMPNFIEICFNNLEFCPKFGYFLSI